MRSVFISNVKKLGIFLVLLLLCGVFAFLSPTFLQTQNIINVLRQISILGIVSFGSTFCVLTGGIDLTIGSVVGLSVVTCSKMLEAGHDIFLSVMVAIIAGGLVGLINAFIICNIGVKALITTLGTYTVVRGVVYVMTGALPVYGLPESFKMLGQGYFAFVPIPVIIMAAVFIIAWIYINKTRHGRYYYAIGGNEEAAVLTGINIKKMKYYAYLISGFCAGLAGVILLSRLNSGQPRAGIGLEFDAVTAIVLGGVSIAGGQGKLSGVLFGVLIIGVLANGLVLLGVNEYWQMIVKGSVLIIAVSLDQLTKARSK